MPQPAVNYETLTPVNFIKRSVEVYPDKIAVINGSHRFTYRQFFARVNRLASALKNIGVKPKDKVAFIAPNIPPMLEAHFAVPMIGAALVAINIRLSPNEVAYILDHSDATVCFVDNEYVELVRPIMNTLDKIKHYIDICEVSDACPLSGLDYESFLLSGSKDDIPIAIEDERDVITINYTSGTTGQPKGVMYHHRGAYLNALADCVETGLQSNSVYLWTLPMFHCNGWCFTWAVTAAGGTHVCLRKVDPADILQLLAKEDVSHMCGAPIVLSGITNHPAFEGVKLLRPLTIAIGGAPPSPTIIAKMEQMGAHVHHVYGLTEVYGPYTICAWQSQWDRLPTEEQAAIRSRQGVAYIVSQFLDVVNPDTMEPVPRNGQVIGEIVMRGNIVMLGYYKDPEATQKAFHKGWFHSGDLAVIHPDNYVQIMDRQKDIIISGGENISTVEVENILYRHPEILEAAVVATPDEKWGEVPKAFVALKEGAKVTEEDIIIFCKQNLAKFKAPKYVEFCALPKTGTGKIQKYVLREKEWENYKQRVN